VPVSINAWPTKKEAAAQLQVSEKTVERLAAAKQIERRERTRVGGSPIAVYNPQDIQRIVSERHGAGLPRDPDVVLSPKLSPIGDNLTPSNVPAKIPPGTAVTVSQGDFAKELGKAIAKALQREQRHLLTLKDAMQLGYSREFIQELVDAGTVRKFGGKRWKVSRFELEDAIRPKHA